MDELDFVIIGAGASGEAAAHEARGRKATVAIVDRDLFGGSCPFWACMPSKSLLHSASVQAMVNTAISEYGRLDYAHNNAGIVGAGAPIAELDEAFGKGTWARRHEARGPEMTAWRRAAAFLDGGVFRSCPPGET